MVIQLLSRNPKKPLSVVKDYIIRVLKSEQEQIVAVSHALHEFIWFAKSWLIFFTFYNHSVRCRMRLRYQGIKKTLRRCVRRSTISATSTLFFSPLKFEFSYSLFFVFHHELNRPTTFQGIKCHACSTSLNVPAGKFTS